MPRSPEQNREIRQKRVQQILDAALSVYREKGYHGTEMGAIARRAGLGRGLIYYYFKDKQDVFLTLMRSHLEEWKEETLRILASDRTVAEKLTIYIQVVIAGSFEHPDIFHFQQSISREINVLFPDRAEEVHGYYTTYMNEPIRALFREAARKGEISVSPEVAEQFFFSVLFGAVNQDCPVRAESVDELVQAMLYGLAGAGAGKPE